MEPVQHNPGRNPSGDAGGPNTISSMDQIQRDEAGVGEPINECEQNAAKHCPTPVTHEQGFQKPMSYSVGAIPKDVGQRDKRAAGRMLSGYIGPYHVDGRGAPSEPLSRPYPPQSKRYGYVPKEISRSMGTTALPRHDLPTETDMVKGATGRLVRQGYGPKRPVMSAHGMSRSVPKQAHLQVDKAEHVHLSSFDALQQDVQSPGLYYTTQPDRGGDYYRKPSRSSTFKPKSADEHYKEQFTAEQQQQRAIQAYKEAEFQKQHWAMAGSYPGDQRHIHDGRYQRQQYAVHVVQETGGNDAFREGGDTGIVKSSGDSSSKFLTVPVDVSDMYVYVRDALTGGDTPLPPSVTTTSTVEAIAVGKGEDEYEGKISTSGSTASSASSSDSESKSESKAMSGSTSTTSIIQYDEAASQALLADAQATEQQPRERESQAPLQQPLQQLIQQQHLLAPMPVPFENADHEKAYQKYVQQHYEQQVYHQSYQPTYTKTIYQQERTNQEIVQDERNANRAPTNVGGGEVPIRVPAEGASLRSFQSRSSADATSVDVEDTRSLQSSTNMGIPLLRPTLAGMGIERGKSSKSHVFIAFNVILFSVLIGVVAAFIIQHVVKE